MTTKSFLNNMTLEQRVAMLEGAITQLLKSDRVTMQKDIQMFDGRNFIFSTATGTKIGTGTTQKLGFYGHAPVARQDLATVPNGAQIAVILQQLGLVNLT